MVEGYSWVKGIEFGEFFLKNLNLTLSPRNFLDIAMLRLGGLQVASSRIGFVREISISFYSRNWGSPKQIQSKFKKKTSRFVL